VEVPLVCRNKVAPELSSSQLDHWDVSVADHTLQGKSHVTEIVSPDVI
jgi:hypothetical protein